MNTVRFRNKSVTLAFAVLASAGLHGCYLFPTTPVTDEPAERPLANITVGPSTIVLTQRGQEVQLSVNAVYANGDVDDVTDSPGNTAYRSSQPSVVEVDGTGLVRAVADGQAEIQIEHRSRSVNVPVMVSIPSDADPRLVRLIATPGALTFDAPGQATQLTIRAIYSDGTERDASGSMSGTMYMSGNSEVVTVTSEGLVMAAAVGEAAITFANGGLSDSVFVLVREPAREPVATVIALRVNPRVINFSTFGERRQLRVTGTRSDGSEIDLTSPMMRTTYASANEQVAMVSDDGVVSAVGAGLTEITVLNGNTSDVAVVSVPGAAPGGGGVLPQEPPTQLARITVDPPLLTFLDLAEREQLSVTGEFLDGATVDLTSEPETEFISEGLLVATVSADGMVAPVARGLVPLRVTHGALSDIVIVQVDVCLPAAPTLNPFPSVTTQRTITMTGRAEVGSQIEMASANMAYVYPTVNGQFSVDVMLDENYVNYRYFTVISSCGARSRPTAATITHDTQAPSLFIDFPIDGASLATDMIDVVGRVGDVLTGASGLQVTVNGTPALVYEALGNNGTFLAAGVPLVVGGPTTITVTATDPMGNLTTKSVVATRTEIPANAARMEIFDGNAQIAPVHQFLPDAIAVRVLRADGSPIHNKVITFKVTRSDGRLTDSSGGEGSMMLQTHTDATGVARALWRMGSDAGRGNNRIEVTSTSVHGSIFFCASATVGGIRQINIGSGNNQRVEVGGQAPEPLRARVSDSCNGIENVPITFTVMSGDGKVNGLDTVTVPTGPTGHAEVRFTLGPNPGNNVVEANYANNPGSPATFVTYGVIRDVNAPTTFSGLVLNNSGQPIQGATCRLIVAGQQPLTTTSNVDGQFRFDSILGAGAANLYIDGLTATHVGGATCTRSSCDVAVGSFPFLHFTPVLTPNTANSLPMPVLLPMLNPNNARTYTGNSDVELTVEGMAGLKMVVRAGTTVKLLDGHCVGPNEELCPPADRVPQITLALNQVHHDDVPMPMPDGAAPPFAWTLQPGGAIFDRPVEITYPNMSALPAGAAAFFLSFNHDTSRFEVVGTGHVVDDGSVIVTDTGSGITRAGWGCNCPPYSVTGDIECCVDSDGCAAANEYFNQEDQCCQACREFEVLGAHSGDIVEVNLSSTGLTEFELSQTANGAGEIAQIDMWEELLTTDGVFYFVPSPHQESLSQLSLSAQCGDDPTNRVQLTVQLDITDGYSSFELESTVGASGTNRRLDVYRVQQRLRYLGFPDKDGNELAVDGQSGTKTQEAIRLFQAATYPCQIETCADGTHDGNPLDSTTTNGKVVPGDMTHAWLQAENSPRWMEFRDDGTCPGGAYDISRPGGLCCNPCTQQDERFGTNWAIDIALAAMSGGGDMDVEIVTAISENGYTSAHSGHKSGMDFDVDIPGCTEVNTACSNHPTCAGFADNDGMLTPQESAVVNNIVDFVIAGGARIQRVCICWQDIRDTVNGIVGGNVAVACSAHHGHFHVDIGPPMIGGAVSDMVETRCTMSCGGSIASGIDDNRLKDNWDLGAAGQVRTANLLGRVLIDNIASPDMFGGSGPGSAPDFLSDDFIRLLGTSVSPDGISRWVFSEPFQLMQGQTVEIGQLTVTDTPPPLIESITFAAHPPVLSNVDDMLQLQLTATLLDGTTQDVTPRTAWTIYRTSNPQVSSIGQDGLVTARGRGIAYITASNEGATATTQVLVTLDDPLTTIDGVVQYENHTPAVGANVSIFGLPQFTGQTDATGHYVITGVPSEVTQSFTVRASFSDGSQSFLGSIANVAPVPDGLTDAGIITIVPGAGGGFGPIILSGMDPEDHGYSGGPNPGPGWEMARDMIYFVATNSALGNPNNPTSEHHILMLGGGGFVISETQALAQSLGFQFTQMSGPAILSADIAPATTPYDVIYMPTSESEADGGLSSGDLARVNMRGTEVIAFVNAGGGIAAFAQEGSGAYAWFPLAGLQTVDIGDGNGITVTPEGQFILSPSATAVQPFHRAFIGPNGFFGLNVLARESFGEQRPLIIGGVANIDQ